MTRLKSLYVAEVGCGTAEERGFPMGPVYMMALLLPDWNLLVGWILLIAFLVLLELGLVKLLMGYMCSTMVQAGRMVTQTARFSGQEWGYHRVCRTTIRYVINLVICVNSCYFQHAVMISEYQFVLKAALKG